MIKTKSAQTCKFHNYELNCVDCPADDVQRVRCWIIAQSCPIIWSNQPPVLEHSTPRGFDANFHVCLDHRATSRTKTDSAQSFQEALPETTARIHTLEGDLLLNETISFCRKRPNFPSVPQWCSPETSIVLAMRAPCRLDSPQKFKSTSQIL
jgi:hypothetical protein